MRRRSRQCARGTSSKPVVALHNDLPTNDWHRLLHVVLGRAQAAVRGFTESSLRDHLFGPGASPEHADSALDQFFARLTARFAADPERDRFEDWTLTVVLARN
jgi:hypothetical protein